MDGCMDGWMNEEEEEKQKKGLRRVVRTRSSRQVSE